MAWQDRKWVCIYAGPDDAAATDIRDVLLTHGIRFREKVRHRASHSIRIFPTRFTRIIEAGYGEISQSDFVRLYVRRRTLEQAQALIGSTYRKLRAQ